MLSENGMHLLCIGQGPAMPSGPRGVSQWEHRMQQGRDNAVFPPIPLLQG